MIITYKNSMAGPYHIDEGLPCQDSCFISMGKDGLIIAAVADGLGSEEFSDIGSQVAAETAVTRCAEELAADTPPEEVRKKLNNSFVEAYRAVLERADKDGNARDEYDTTLCLAVYDPASGRLFYGQSGDSGLVALLSDGSYKQLTRQQRDEGGCVYPLCFGPDYWEFGEAEGRVSAFMLMTDGVFEQICPKLMKKEEVTVNVPLAQKFLDRFDCPPDKVSELEQASAAFLEKYPRSKLDDDKTVVAVINTDAVPARREESYYAPPDWTALYQKAMKKIYPPPPKQEPAGEAVPEEAASAEKSGGETRPARLRRTAGSSLRLLAALSLITFGVMSWIFREELEKCSAIGSLGLVWACFLANSSILLPSASIPIVLEYSLVIGPLQAAFFGAFGASMGEMTGYLVGRSGSRIVPKKISDRFCALGPRCRYAAVFVFSALPLPFFDLIGMLSGALRLRVTLFCTMCFLGKLIKMLFYVLLTQIALG